MEGGINGEADKFRPKTINGDGAIYGQVGKNREAGENTAFIEIKSSNDFVKISTKRT